MRPNSYKDANGVGEGEVESKQEQELSNKERTHQGEKILGGLALSQFLEGGVDENVEKETNQTDACQDGGENILNVVKINNDDLLFIRIITD